MKILQVATLFTPDSVFGGPPRVAVQQSAELLARGHSVTLAGAASGWDPLPDKVNEVPCRFRPARTAIPGIGFAGLTARGLSRILARELGDFDIVHVHMARDLVTLPVAHRARRLGVPYVLQCHGMIDPSARLLSVPLDRLRTVRTLRGARRVLTLTEREDHDVAAVARQPIATTRVTNSVPYFDDESDCGHEVVGDPPEVLYLARLDPRKRPEMFVRAANTLLDQGVRARFTLVGPDTGSGRAVDVEIERGGHDAIRREPAVAADEVCRRIARAAVYVLPSVDEPFPMSVLEAMSVGRPVVVTNSCGLAQTVSTNASGVVVDDSQEQLTAAIRDLLCHPRQSAEAGARGRRSVREDFTVARVVDALERVYDEAIHGAARGRTEANRAGR